MPPVAAILVRVIAADEVRIALADGVKVRIVAEAKHRQRAALVLAEPRRFRAVAYMAEAQTIYERMLAMGIPGVSLEACEAMISQLKKMYWRYYDFVDENMELCRRHGFIRCPSSGRKRFLGFRPELTKVANTPIQSGVAGIRRERLTEIRKCKPAPAKQVLYLYDAGVWECPRGSVADEMMALIKETWTRPVKLLSNGSTWVQPIDTKVAERWSEL